MKYHISKVVGLSFEEALIKVTDTLKEEGFGILTEIDVKATLKKKLDVEFRQYKILGACNPNYAYQALQLERHIGTLLPCSVIVQETIDGKTEVAAVNPLEAMKSVENENLGQIAQEVYEKLKRAIEKV